jgi:hypothetical protein
MQPLTTTNQATPPTTGLIPNFQQKYLQPTPASVSPPVQPTQTPVNSSFSGIDKGALDLTHAIALQESSKDGVQPNYSASGDAGTSYGAYQWNNGKQPLQPGQLPTNFINGAKKAGLDPTDFSPENQDKVAYSQVLAMKNQGLNPEQISAAWNAGIGHINDWQNHVGSTEINGQILHYDTPTYVSNVHNYYQQLAGDGTMDQTTPTSTTQDTANKLPTYGASFEASSNDNPFVAGFKALGNVPSSLYGLGAGVVGMALHPIQTVENIGRGVIGGVENLTGQNQGNPDENQLVANAIGKSIIDRYGGLEQLQNTATNDPAGFGADIASILAGGAGIIGKGAELSKLGEGIAQTISKPVTDVVSKAVSPLTGLLGKGNPEIMASADRLGINLPAGAITNNPFIRTVEAFGSTGLGSTNYADRVATAVSKLDEFANSIVRSTGGSEDLTTAGSIITKGTTEFTNLFKKTNEELYGAIDKQAGNVVAQTSPALSALNKIIEDKTAIGDTTNLKFFEEKKNVLLGAGSYSAPTFDTLRKIKTNLGELIDAKFQDPFAKTNIKQLKQLYGGVEQSLGETIKSTGDKELYGLYKTANQKYVEGINQISSQYGRTIQRLGANGQFDKIAEDLIKSSTPIEDIPKIKALIGEQGTANLAGGVLSKIIKNAKNSDGDFTPTGISRELKKFETADGRNKLEEILTPEQYQGIQDVGKLTKALGDAQKMSMGSQTAFLSKSWAETGLVGVGAYKIVTGDLIGGLQAIGGAIGAEGASLFISSDTGQRLLKYVATRGNEFKIEGAKVGLTQKADDSNIDSNGTLNGTVSGIPFGNSLYNGTTLSSNSVEKQPRAVPSSSVNTVTDGSNNALLDELAKAKGFDLQGALKEGYSEQEIRTFLDEKAGGASTLADSSNSKVSDGKSR